MSLISFIRDTAQEAKKVKWPTIDDIKMALIAVVVIVGLVAGYLICVDFCIYNVIALLIGIR